MKQSEFFSSRWGLILAALGMAVGTGNIWRFPRIVAENGGGSFLIPWIIFLFLWSIPLLIIEFSLGKETRMGTVGAFGKFLGKKFTWMGAFVGFCTMAIMFYYSVVMGWCVKFLVASFMGDSGLAQSEQYWNTFTSGYQPVFFHFIAMALGSFVIYKGVVRGIEKANKILIPTLFLLLILAAARALTLPGAIAGLDYLFKPDLDLLLNYKTWLEALTQSAWSTGAGWGLILTYAVYMKKKEDVVLNSFIAGLGNNSASLIAAMAILPTIFAILPYDEAMQAVGAGNQGLTFIWIPQLFGQMPFGSFFMTIFFLALTAAALSSLIAMIELSTRIFMDAGLQRPKAILFVGSCGFLLGLPSAFSLNFLNNQDWVWGLGLILSGIFVAFAAIKYGVDKFRTELVNSEGNDIAAGTWFNVIVKFVIPIEFLVLLGWWFWKTIAGDPEGWWTPFKTYSLGTVLLQWAIALVVLIAAGNWLYKRTVKV
ncbi:sodium-dependent transporter [candidate division KSB1 bacterium]|nr:sodium-dependent transporter [candidate division KSB1 bacterium]